MCHLPSKLCVGNNLRQLKILSVSHCEGLEDIEVCARNVKTFDYQGDRLVQLKFSKDCKIENVFLKTDECGMDRIFGNLSADLPHLKKMSLAVPSSVLYQMPPNPSTFSSVECLHLFIIERDDQSDIVKALPSLLNSLPQLQKLFVRMPNGFEWRTTEENRALCLHSHLKEVEIGCFHGVPNQISFAIYLLRSAIALEEMVLDKCVWKYVRCGLWAYDGCGEWVHDRMPLFHYLCGRLEREALSKNVKIIFK